MIEELSKSVYQQVDLLIKRMNKETGLENYDDSVELLRLLESFITIELRKKYNDWKFESIDGIYPGNISMTEENQIKIIGMCILTSDQSVVPIFINIKISDLYDDILWMKCKLAESKSDGVYKVSYNSNKWRKEIFALDMDKINWFYSVDYNK